MGQHAAPGVEDHHGLGAGFDLGVEVGGDGLGGDAEDVVHEVGAAVEQALDLAVVVGAAAFDHVAGERPGLPEKPISGTELSRARRISATASIT
jgi:hypothetical protein